MFSLPSAEYGMHGKYRILAELGVYSSGVR